MWKQALSNRVRLTPSDREETPGRTRPRASSASCDKDVTNADPDVDDYFENLRKKFRFDDEDAAAVSIPQTAAFDVTPKATLPFDGIVVYLHKKVEDQRSELTRAVEVLGGQLRWQHCKEVTHFVHQGKLGASKEMRSAKEWNQKFVAPQWILDCEDAQARLDEAHYPASLNILYFITYIYYLHRKTEILAATKKTDLTF